MNLFFYGVLRSCAATIGRVGALVLACLTLTACSVFDDPTPDYRYRLTVEVETPEGLRTGSSVLEVEQRLVRPGQSPANVDVRRRVRGEAVAVDLPGGQTLFALLRSDRDIEWASRVVHHAAPRVEGETHLEVPDNIFLIEGVVELPREWPRKGPYDPWEGRPMFVTFGDINDPTSVMRVDPDDLAASFGEGVRLKRLTVEITEDEVTTGLDQRLTWLGMSFKDFSRDDFPEEFPVGDINRLFIRGIQE
jgi:hypothetical protein